MISTALKKDILWDALRGLSLRQNTLSLTTQIQYNPKIWKGALDGARILELQVIKSKP